MLQGIRVLGTTTAVTAFAAFVNGQGSTPMAPQTPFEEVARVAGWIAIVTAGLTYVVLNIYNAVRGKNYEQLKEAMSNWEKLAESRKAQLSEKDAALSECRAEKHRLEVENERLAEKILRK